MNRVYNLKRKQERKDKFQGKVVDLIFYAKQVECLPNSQGEHMLKREPWKSWRKVSTARELKSISELEGERDDGRKGWSHTQCFFRQKILKVTTGGPGLSHGDNGWITAQGFYMGWRHLRVHRLASRRVRLGGRGTTSNAGAETKVRNDGCKGVNKLNNYLNAVVWSVTCGSQQDGNRKDKYHTLCLGTLNQLCYLYWHEQHGQ